MKFLCSALLFVTSCATTSTSTPVSSSAAYKVGDCLALKKEYTKHFSKEQLIRASWTVYKIEKVLEDRYLMSITYLDQHIMDLDPEIKHTDERTDKTECDVSKRDHNLK